MARYDHILFDLDGTLFLGDQPLHGAADAVAGARLQGLGVLFLTNDGQASRDAHVARLVRAGIPASVSQVLTAGRTLAQRVAAEHWRARVLTIGTPALDDECRLVGLTPVREPERAEAVLVVTSLETDMSELTAATRAISSYGAALFCGSRDATYPTRDGPVPGCGAIVAAIEAATGITATSVGKPEVAMFDEATRLLGSGRMLMVGDRLDSDILGGHRAGLDTALVLTGSTEFSDLERWGGPVPTMLLGGVHDLISTLSDQTEAMSFPTSA